MLPKRVTPVIICGGAGTRLWPLSRADQPKQFLPLLDGQSTFQHALHRVAAKELFDPPVVLTASEFRFLVAEQLHAAGYEALIVLEPERRDSGPAIAAAAEAIAQRDPAATLLILAADHVIRNEDAFRAACREAVSASEGGRIVTFGIPPTFPSTEYGYIRCGAALDGCAAHHVESFVEKPDAVTAARYVTDGYLWNSGNFMFRADVMLEEIARLEPAMATAVKAAVGNAAVDLDFVRLEPAAFARAPKKSIDHAVMERTGRAAVVRGEFDWSDMGGWNALWEIMEPAGHGNRARGAAAFLDSRNNLVYAGDGMLAAVVGIDDLVVVATAHAVLVVPREQAAKVRALVEELRPDARGDDARRRVYRPWGHYERIAAGPRHQVKRIVVKPGAKLSLQKHARRAEHWVVVKGTAEVTAGAEVRAVRENESVHIPIGCVHRLANPGAEPLELVEVQIGDYLGEDDIVRLDDIYERK